MPMTTKAKSEPKQGTTDFRSPKAGSAGSVSRGLELFFEGIAAVLADRERQAASLAEGLSDGNE